MTAETGAAAGADVVRTYHHATSHGGAHDRSLLTPLVDLLFVRRQMSLSLGRTLARFGPVLAESRQRSVG